jgi:hypothetical protein
MCVENDEPSKYLMTFQNLLSRVPKWNNVIVEEERKRIIERSGCNYLEDLITCVHIIQLKVLTCIRVGNKQKKIDISIPKLDHFIHKIYINVARKVYTNVYLYEKNLAPLQIQRNNRELELLVQECIMMAIRESIPTEAIIRAYMDESIEQEEEVIIENIDEPSDLVKNLEEKKDENETKNEPIQAPLEPEIPDVVPSIKELDNEPVITRLTFNDLDSVMDDKNVIQEIEAPKNIERLQEIANTRAMQRKLEEEEDNERIQITTEPFELTGIDVLDIENVTPSEENIKLDFEELV